MLKIVSDTRDIGERKTIYFLKGFTKPAGRSTFGLSAGCFDIIGTEPKIL